MVRSLYNAAYYIAQRIRLFSQPRSHWNSGRLDALWRPRTRNPRGRLWRTQNCRFLIELCIFWLMVPEIHTQFSALPKTSLCDIVACAFCLPPPLFTTHAPASVICSRTPLLVRHDRLVVFPLTCFSIFNCCLDHPQTQLFPRECWTCG